MLIQINTDNNIEGRERMEVYFRSVLEESLHRFEDHITRLEVHLGDENSEKFGTDDKRCMIEARLAGKQPIAVINHSDTTEKSFNGAIEKMKKVLATTFDKMKTY
ncbi:MAG: HPF/RaiA family ribosome-associated protein [Flavobacterium sp.]|nr:HPF/RaiA family ribosome-associated protein [Flavobacterium sp.]